MSEHARQHVHTLWQMVQEELGNQFWQEPMAKHVTFGFDRAKRRIGRASYDLSRRNAAMRLKGDPARFNKLHVQYSKHYAAKLVDSPHEHLIEDTLRHEAAHIFNFVENGRRHDGHGPLWKQWARRCGADPTRTKDVPDEVTPDYSWKRECETCGNWTGYHRKPTAVRSCAKCSPSFSEEYIMVVKRM